MTQRAPIFKNFNRDFDKNRENNQLRCVMGLTDDEKYIDHEPDSTYELTIDNCLKMMAIYMRFRCNIPVIIMGETGCGKTRLIKFLCDLHIPKTREKEQPLPIQSLLHVKGSRWYNSRANSQ